MENNDQATLIAQERAKRRREERARIKEKERREALGCSAIIAIFMIGTSIYFLSCDLDDFGFWYLVGGFCLFYIIGLIGRGINIMLGRHPDSKF